MKLFMNTNRSMPRTPRLRRLATWLVAACFMAISFSSFAGVFVSVSIAPPPLPIYAQPVMPGAGYIWTPGYWAYGDGGYFWVPGTWVLAPYVGALWTPGYWGWSNGFYVFNRGYWGPRVGFYGGINYGYGYEGVGYRGGYWDHGRFNYNRNVTYNTTISRVSYNGGRGGLMARPSPQEQMAARDRHMQPLAAQQQQIRMASENRSLRASVNHGAPPIAATPRAGAFNGNGVVRARGTMSPAMSAAAARTARTGYAPSQRANTVNSRTVSQASYNAQRSAGNVPRNNNGQRPAPYNRTNAYAAPARNAPNHQGQGSMRPATANYRPAYQQPRPQAQPHAQPVRSGGGNRGEHPDKH
ncbi:hypothetical protein B0E46_04905 [Rhodanobacter sp. B04]|uniref:YXWGXW repeat-containing protein n=1 Tax=Rhodanobacter sp. B04 TaxID=1945860 RepID=UPI0009849D7D|nr:YXWGXW repeat-containing protein [Rhodanobacter sp. B04]OOG64753.1 hypothetical protein B0E46_04905 [Rhodanobacter sp. B04]